MKDDATDLFTIGHTTHSWDRFIALLRRAGVTEIADVRTSPYSRYCPQFNRDELREELHRVGISYVFLGDELGGRPSESQLYCEGVADYDKIAKTAKFHNGLERVVAATKQHRIALMCSEQDPLDCHRCLLVGRALAERGLYVAHILSNGEIMSQAKVEDKLLELSGRDADDFFSSRAQRLTEAYRDRARRVAFAERQPDAKVGSRRSDRVV